MNKNEIENRINELNMNNNKETIAEIKNAIISVENDEEKNELNKELLKKLVQLAKEKNYIEDLRKRINNLTDSKSVEALKEEIRLIDNKDLETELNNLLLNKIVSLMSTKKKENTKVEELSKRIEEINDANDEKNIIALDNDIAAIKDEKVVAELRNKLLSKLKCLQTEKVKANKKVSKTHIDQKASKKINVKVVLLTGAIGLGSIIGGLTLANKTPKDNTNSNSITTSNNDYSNNNNNSKNDSYGMKLCEYGDSYQLDKSNKFHTKGEDCFYGMENDTEGEHVCFVDGKDIFSCKRNFKHDDFEYDIEYLIDMMKRKNIPMQEIHNISDEDRKEIQDVLEEAIANNDSEAAASYLERCGADPAIIWNVMEHHIIFNKNARFIDENNQEYQRGMEQWFVGHSQEDNDYYFMESALFGGMSYYEDYMNNFKMNVTTYATVHNVSEDEAEQALKEEFLSTDESNENTSFYTKNQAQRFEDCFYSLFCQYINEVGIDQFKNSYSYLFYAEKQLVKSM